MNNFTSMVVAMLEHLHLLSDEEAEKLAKELHGRMLPDTYKGSSALLKEVFDKIDINSFKKVLDTKK